MIAIAIVAIALVPLPAPAQSEIKGWGWQVFDSAWNQEPFAGIAAGHYHTVARRPDGSVVAWGNNDGGQCLAPALAPDSSGPRSVAVRATRWVA